MATSITYGYEDLSGDIGYTGFTLDGAITLDQVRAFATSLVGMSDNALAHVAIKESQRVDTSAVTKGPMECERRGVVILEHDNGTLKRRYQVSIPGISQSKVVLNNPGVPTLTLGTCTAVRGYFATLSGIPAADLFVVSSRLYESRR